MKTVPLADVCEIVMGQAPKGDTYNTDGVGLPLIAGAGDFDGLHPTVTKYTTADRVKTCKPGDIVLSIRASIGTKVLADGEYCLGRGVAGLRARNDLDDRYLWHWTTAAASTLAAKGRGATFLQVNKADISELEIPLPPLEEQRRIASVLDAADELRVKRREALAAIRELQDAVVAECLQQYAQRVPLGDHLEFVTSGSRGWARYYSETGSRFIRSQDVGLGEILDDGPAFVTPPDGAEARRTRVQKGDLLVTITGTVGRVTAADEDLVGSHISQHVAIARPSKSLRPKFAEAFMCSLPGQIQLERAQYGQTKPGLNLTQIREFQLPVPSLGQQDVLLARLDAISQERSRLNEFRHRLEGLFASLQQRAFRGEL